MPDILGKIDTFVSSIRVHAPLAMQQIRDNLKIPSIVCRSAAVHRNSWGAVLNAVVVIDRVDDAAMADAIRRHRRRIIRLVGGFKDAADVPTTPPCHRSSQQS